jgi:hypothetical protein
LLLAPLAAFALHEVLKNAMGAHVRRVGGDAGRLDELPPVRVSVGARGATGFVKVEDHGGGWPVGTDGARALRYLHSTNPPREANYTYSRNFGTPFEGLGVGLPLAHLHASLLGGGLTLAAMPGRGVTALLCFDLSGEAPSYLTEESEDAEVAAAALPRFRAPPPRQLHGFATGFASRQREFRTAIYSKREPRAAADDAAAVAAGARQRQATSALLRRRRSVIWRRRRRRRRWRRRRRRRGRGACGVMRRRISRASVLLCAAVKARGP